jgi:hypothetical protein
MTPSTESAGLDARLPPEMAPVGLFVAAFDPTFVAAEGLDAVRLPPPAARAVTRRRPLRAVHRIVRPGRTS